MATSDYYDYYSPVGDTPASVSGGGNDLSALDAGSGTYTVPSNFGQNTVSTPQNTTSTALSALDAGMGDYGSTGVIGTGTTAEKNAAQASYNAANPSNLSSTLNDISKFISTNKGILGLGAAASLASSGGGGGGSGSSSAGIPNLVASRMQVPGAGSIVTPGQANQQYFTDTLYTDPSQQANAMAAIEAQAQAIAANRTNAPVPNFAMNYNNMPSTTNLTPASSLSNLYTNYTPEQIGNYINTSGINLNDPAAVAAATKTANANPAVVNQYIASLNKTGTTTGVAALPGATKYTTYTPDQITNYIKTSGINLNDPAAVAAALKQANMDPAAFQSYLASTKATGTATTPLAGGTSTPGLYVNGSPAALAAQAALSGGIGSTNATPGYTTYTPDQITNYIKSSGINLNDPAAVAAAEKQANMDPASFEAYQKSQDYNNFLNIIGKGSASTAPSTEAANSSGVASLPASNLVAGQTDQAISSDQVPTGSSGTAASTTATNAPANADTIQNIISQGQAAGQDPATMAAQLISAGIPAADVIAVVGAGNADVVNQAYADAAASNPASYGGDTAAAHGGLMSLNYAEGGATPPRYLQGHTDGMADELNTSIDGVQPAKLSHGEFVIPADVVSHLGNGNSDAGAKKLYEMMSRVRKARTGNEKQGKRIDPDKFMYGGKAYAAGGIAKFAGPDGSVVPSTTSSTAGIPGLTNTGGTSTQGLSSYVAPYVTNMLGQGQALANTSMPVYQGPLTAGQSALQNQQFMGLSEMAQTGYNPMQFQTQNWSNQGAPQMPNTSVPSQTQSVSQAANQGTADYGQPMNLGTGQGSSPASQYMNPYLSQSLQPQLNLLAQNAKINEQGDLGKLTSQGAFGGSRQAVLQGMDQNALLGQQANLIGQGYNTAYNDAQAQFNADQQRQLQAQQNTEASRQFSGNFGQQTLQALGTAGGVQQGIQNAADQAAYAEFQKQQQYPYQQLAFEQSLLQGLPTGSTTTTPNAMSDLGTALAALGVVQNPALSSIFGSSTPTK